MGESSAEPLRGTIDLLVLRTLSLAPMHGWGLTHRIQQGTDGVLEVNQGSLYPALQRLEQKEWIDSEWRVTDNNRRAKYYRLTPLGRKALGAENPSWRRTAAAEPRAGGDSWSRSNSSCAPRNDEVGMRGTKRTALWLRALVSRRTMESE